MTWAYSASITPVNSKTADQSSLAITYTGTAEDFIVLAFAIDNEETTDGYSSCISSITSTEEIDYIAYNAYTNTTGSTQAGVTIGIVSFITKTTGSNTITINLTSNTLRDASAITGARFTRDSTKVILSSWNASADTAADPSALGITTNNAECLRIRAIATESEVTTALTATASWTAITGTNSSGGVSASNVGIRLEYLINTATSASSNPTLYSGTHANLYAAFQEWTHTAKTFS